MKKIIILTICCVFLLSACNNSTENIEVKNGLQLEAQEETNIFEQDEIMLSFEVARYHTPFFNYIHPSS